MPLNAEQWQGKWPVATIPLSAETTMC